MSELTRMGPELLPPKSLDPIAFCNLANPFDGSAVVCRGHGDPQVVHGAAESHGSAERPAHFFARARSFLTWTRHPTTRENHKSSIPDPPYLQIQRSHRSRLDHLERSSVDQQEGSALLQLPTEIRIMVYERLLCTHTIQLNLEYAPHLIPCQFQWHFWHRLFLWPTFDDNRGTLTFWLRFWQPTTASRENPRIKTLSELAKYKDELRRFKDLREGEPKVAIAILRTCRKVYSEATQVIYQTNTFMFRSDVLLRKLDRFLLPSSVAFLQSVELIWELTPQHQPFASLNAKRSYNELWSCLDCSKLPSLSSLVVVINPRSYNEHQPSAEASHDWLDPVDIFASSRRLNFFEFAMPRSYFECLDLGGVNTRIYHLRRFPDPPPPRIHYYLPPPEQRLGCPLSFQSFAPGQSIHAATCSGCIPRDGYPDH